MDHADIAAKNIEARDEIVITNWQRLHHMPTNTVRVEYCVDCGEPIPKARQEAVPGCTRCVICQRAYEEK